MKLSTFAILRIFLFVIKYFKTKFYISSAPELDRPAPQSASPPLMTASPALHSGAPGGSRAVLHQGAPAGPSAPEGSTLTVHTSVRGGSENTSNGFHVSVIHLSFLYVYSRTGISTHLLRLIMILHALLVRAAAPIVVAVLVFRSMVSLILMICLMPFWLKPPESGGKRVFLTIPFI